MSLNERAVRVLSIIPSVFLRLIVSYVVLVFLVAVTVSGVSYLYFTSVYNKELDNFHELYLKNIEKELSSQVVEVSKQIYMELDSQLSQRDGDLFAPEDSTLGDSSKIYKSYLILNDIIARHYDRLEAVHIYYIQSGLLVSSTGFQSGEATVPRGDGKQWLAELRSRKARSSWSVYKRPVYLGIPAMELFRSIRCFPILSSPESCSVIVCLDFRADYLAGIMARLSPGEGGRTALMFSDSLEYIDSSSGPKWGSETESRLRGAIEGGVAGFSSQRTRLGGSMSLLTSLPLSDSGWSLVNVVPLHQLYQRSGGIRFVLIAICLVAIALGALVAFFVASGIYNPLELLLRKFRSLFGLPLPAFSRGADEYRVIDEAISGISSRMGELVATVEANGPIISHELVYRLLEGERVEPEEVRDTIELLGKGPLPAKLRASLFFLSPEAGSKEEGEGGQVLKYLVADELGRSGCILSSALSGDRVGIVAEGEGGADLARYEEWLSLVASRSGSRARVAVGSLVPSPGELSDSFVVARELSEYFFLFPELSILSGRDDLLSRSGRSALPYKEFPESLAQRLRSRDLPGFKGLLASYRAGAREGDCQARACRSELEGFCLVVSDFARESGLGSGAPLDRSLSELLAEARSIDAFLEELSSAAAEICAGAEDPQRRRNSLMVARIKAYAAENLSGDLSLDRVGDAVAVSPGYMGKIFKEETGRNYVSYITEIRLAEAARLLSETRESVQEIGRRVGINTPAYFIRLFRGRYGQTPLDYRRSCVDAKPGE
jgi:AraC-like DNA-binding protein